MRSKIFTVGNTNGRFRFIRFLKFIYMVFMKISRFETQNYFAWIHLFFRGNERDVTKDKNTVH